MTVQHISCDNCGSSDANALYEDGHAYCFSCQTYTPASDAEYEPQPKPQPKQMNSKIEQKGTIKAIPSRNISTQTCEKYDVTQLKGETSDVHYYPYYDESGSLVGCKVRTVATKEFFIDGSLKNAGLFGQHLFPKGGKYVTIVEGELDALAAYQMTGSQWPVVSIKNGAEAALRDCKQAYEWLDSFETVVICFDADEPGKKAAKAVAELFGSKAKVFKHEKGYKDACDYLMQESGKAFVNLWWKAEEYRPEGIVTVSDIKQRLLTPPEPGVPWAFDTLTRLTYGRRKGELYAFGAGVGVGKTDVFTQQIAYDIQTLGKKVGVIYLEQPVTETAQRVAGKMDKKLYHIPDAQWTLDEYYASVDRLEQEQKLYLFEHFGAMDWTTIKNVIKFFAKAYDIEMIYLDHLTALSANEQDERRALDGIMADMASLAQSLGIVIHFVSHLTTPEGKPHEEGGRVMEKHFTGSRAIARWSHYMFGLERNKQDEDPVRRQTTTFRVLKDRHTGRATAEKFGLFYNKDSGILTECVLEEQEPL